MQYVDAAIAASAYRPVRPPIIGNYHYVARLSSRDAAVYVSHAPRRHHNAVIAYTGTHRLADVVPDMDIVAGTRMSYRWHDSLRTFDRVHESLGVKPRVVGHSLGASLARYVASNRSARVTTFSLPFARWAERYHREKRYGNAFDVVTGFSGAAAPEVHPHNVSQFASPRGPRFGGVIPFREDIMSAPSRSIQRTFHSA
jgi:hypothetical protein